MNIDEIEYKIATNEMTAAQVFTQMKQIVDSEHKNGWNNAIDAAVHLLSSGAGVDADYLYEQLHSK